MTKVIYNLEDQRLVSIFDNIIIEVPTFSGPLSAKERESYFPEGLAKFSVNVYLLKICNQYVLIDAGLGNSKSELLLNLKKLNVKIEEIKIVFVTHVHDDHIGGLIKENVETHLCTSVFPNASIFISAKEKATYIGNGSFGGIPDKLATAYGERLKTFEWGQELLPGLKAIDLSGHTIGHTGFELILTPAPTCSALAYSVPFAHDRILFCGDFIHNIELQTACPEEYPAVDMDVAKAVATRRALLERAVRENLLLAPTHMAFPGVGSIGRNPDMTYRYTPI